MKPRIILPSYCPKCWTLENKHKWTREISSGLAQCIFGW